MSIKRVLARIAVTLLTAVFGAVVLAPSAADAAVPDRFGFALWSGGAVSNAVPAATSVGVFGPAGRWIVKFPGQGWPGGVVHVTAVHDAVATPLGRFCQVDRWWSDTSVPPNELAVVSCYKTTGVLDPTPGFSVMWSASSGAIGGGLYGYMANTAGCGVVATYNSVGGANSCIHAGPGQYSVNFAGLATPGPMDGSIEVTAVNPNVAARCKPVSWSSGGSQAFRIFCYNNAGVLTDNAFNVTYQFKRSLYGPAFPPSRFGYIFNAPGAGPPTTNYNSVAGTNAWGGGPPVWTVKYYQLSGGGAPGNSQAVSFGVGPNFCGLSRPWVVAGVDIVAFVNCFDNAGNPVNDRFTNSYSSRV